MADVREQYLKNQVSGSSPEQLLILLLEGGERFIRKADAELQRGNMDEVHNNLIKAQNIYLELFCSLNPNGGEFVGNLQGLYYIMYENLMDANVRKDQGIINNCLQIAHQLTKMWRETIDKYNGERMNGNGVMCQPANIDIRG
jgi:flagellar protein FliS